MKNILRPTAILVIFFALSPFILIYFGKLTYTAIWCWAWLALFAWFTFSGSDLDFRGLALIIGSVLITIFGKHYLTGKEEESILDVISQVFLVTGGGVGGNFLAHSMLRKHGQSN